MDRGAAREKDQSKQLELNELDLGIVRMCVCVCLCATALIPAGKISVPL